jgi:thiamine-phosphate pyrophosphorylase
MARRASEPVAIAPLSPFARPILCLVLDRASARHPLAEMVEATLRTGVDWVQLRERALEGADWLEWAEEMAAAAQRANPQARVIVNRRLDVALAIRADGAHLGFDAPSVADARSLLGADALIGESAHSPEEVRAAAEAGASYAQLAPIFDPRSKPATRPALGMDALQRATAHGLPVLAQGGIDAARCAEVVRHGAAGVAVTGALLMADDPERAAAELRAALGD